MLIEAWRLSQALKKRPLPRKHKRVQEPGRANPCLRIRLGRNGEIAAVEAVGDDEWPSWTVAEGNQSSFPVVRVQEPLLSVPPKHEIWGKLGYNGDGQRRKPPSTQQRLAVLNEALREFSAGLHSKKTRDLWSRLRDRKAKELLQCGSPRSQGDESLCALAERFEWAAMSPENFVQRLAQSVITLPARESSTIGAVESLLVGNGPSKEKNGRLVVPPMRVQLAFDLLEADQSGIHIYSAQTKEHVINTLPAEPSWEQGAGWHGIDSFTGEEALLEEKTFPKVALPVPSSNAKRKVGRKSFPLSSMFHEAKCNRRYGLTDARIFPVAKERALKLKEAFEFITDDKRRKRTWQHVANGRFEIRNRRKVERQDLLIAYVEDQPELDANTAGYFGQGADVQADQFEVDAAAVCQALEGVVAVMPKSRLNLFLIRDVSKAQAQVVLAESPTVREVLDAAKRWQEAVAANLPSVRLRLPEEVRSGKRLPESNGKPRPPYPDRVVRLLSREWVRDGSSPKGPSGKRQKPNHEVVGPSLAEVLALMLRTEGKWEPATHNLLDLLIRRLAPLLIGLFSAKHAFHSDEDDRVDDYPRESREAALAAIAVLGIVLDAMGCRKERYMENAAYQIGQVLALADTLHKSYCIVVRKGQMPTSLIGTALVRRALDNPAAAVADLGERMVEYVRWAKTADPPHRPDDGSEEGQKRQKRRRRAYYEANDALRRCEPLATRLGHADLPTQCDDILKAQILLGFLAAAEEEEQASNRKDG